MRRSRRGLTASWRWRSGSENQRPADFIDTPDHVILLRVFLSSGSALSETQLGICIQAYDGIVLDTLASVHSMLIIGAEGAFGDPAKTDLTGINGM
jgi:hypothetical protein